MFGYKLGNSSVDGVWYNGSTTTVLNRFSQVVHETSYTGKLGAYFYILTHPLGAGKKI